MLNKLLFIVVILLTLVGEGAASTTVLTRASAAPAVQDRKNQTVYITNTGEKYHRGTCRHLKKSKIPIKKKDAIAEGYTACKVCKP